MTRNLHFHVMVLFKGVFYVVQLPIILLLNLKCNVTLMYVRSLIERRASCFYRLPVGVFRKNAKQKLFTTFDLLLNFGNCHYFCILYLTYEI